MFLFLVVELKEVYVFLVIINFELIVFVSKNYMYIVLDKDDYERCFFGSICFFGIFYVIDVIGSEYIVVNVNGNLFVVFMIIGNEVMVEI